MPVSGDPGINLPSTFPNTVQDRGIYRNNPDGTMSVEYPAVPGLGPADSVFKNLGAPVLTEDERQANLDYTRAKTEKLVLENKKLGIEIKDTLASPDEAQVYPFFSEIDAVTTVRFVQTTSMWSRRNPGSDITVLLSSFGGSVVAGLAMHDHILGLRNKGHKVTIKVLASAASMAAIILQAGSERLIGSNAVIMLHEGSAMFEGSRGDFEDSGKMWNLMHERCEKAICDRSGMTTRKYRSMIRRKDCWLSAEESLSLALVDRIED